MAAPDLRQYWYKLLAGVLSTLTSRKFWAMAAADLAAYQQLLEKTITADAFLLVVVGSAVAFMATTAYEDKGKSEGQSKVAVATLAAGATMQAARTEAVGAVAVAETKRE